MKTLALILCLLAGVAHAQIAGFVTNGLVGAYVMEDGSFAARYGTNAGVAQGSAGQSAGISGGALDCNTTAKYLKLDNASAFDFISGFTVTCRVLMTNNNVNSNDLVVKDDTQAATRLGWVISVSPATLRPSINVFCKDNVAANRLAFQAVYTMALNVWTSLAFVWNGGTTSSSCSIYVNGASQTLSNVTPAAAFTGATNSTYQVGIGRRTDTGGLAAQLNWQGKIDNVLIYNRPLSAQEIAFLANFKPQGQQ